MTHYRPFLVGWFLISSTLVFAAPKTKFQGKHTQAGRAVAAMQARQQAQNKTFKPLSSKNSAEPADELSVDSVLYRAQKMAGELTQEVGYLLKATGPWLKEIEGMIRGEDAAITEVAATSPGKGSKPATTAVVPAASPKVAANGKKLPRRQLGQMSSNPNSILETVMSVSKETWEKVHAVVADLMSQAKSIAD